MSKVVYKLELSEKEYDLLIATLQCGLGHQPLQEVADRIQALLGKIIENA